MWRQMLNRFELWYITQSIWTWYDTWVICHWRGLCRCSTSDRILSQTTAAIITITLLHVWDMFKCTVCKTASTFHFSNYSGISLLFINFLRNCPFYIFTGLLHPYLPFCFRLFSGWWFSFSPYFFSYWFSRHPPSIVYFIIITVHLCFTLFSS